MEGWLNGDRQNMNPTFNHLKTKSRKQFNGYSKSAKKGKLIFSGQTEF